MRLFYLMDYLCHEDTLILAGRYAKTKLNCFHPGSSPIYLN